MSQKNPRETRTADILSAALLWLATLLAGAYGPLSGTLAVDGAQPSQQGIGEPGRQASPASPERGFVATDWRELKCTPAKDGGDPKAALPSVAANLCPPPRAQLSATHAAASSRLSPAHSYGARAPPLLS